MVVLSAQATPTARVTARLQAEGWVKCSNLGFPALSQSPLSDLRNFVLSQLGNSDGRMLKRDLKLNALIFSIPAHQFEVHPQLENVLNQLAVEGTIEMKPDLIRPKRQHSKPDVAVVLRR